MHVPWHRAPVPAAKDADADPSRSREHANAAALPAATEPDAARKARCRRAAMAGTVGARKVHGSLPVYLVAARRLLALRMSEALYYSSEVRKNTLDESRVRC